MYLSATQPLADLLGRLSGPAANADLTVAFAGNAHRTQRQLATDVLALLAARRGRTGERWLVETEDAYRIAVALMAAACAGSRLVLPPNLQLGTLHELRKTCDLVLGDEVEESGNASEELSLHVVRIDRTAPLVDLFTSGSSGPGKLVTKALCHLEDEVVELERSLGQQLGKDAAVIATVPAHHLYGLLFRVLWPLAFARPFCRSGFLLPDDVLAAVADLPKTILVSSPAHLRHLAASPRLAQYAERIAVVFSSGGPLESSTALALETAIGHAPIEIFGSTETGGVASRRASRGDPSPRWTPLSPVIVAADEDGSLVVTSPFVTSPVAPPSTWRMGDRIELDGQGFRLLGRNDRLAKVGEKTVSLPEIEARLVEHQLIDAAMVAAYREKGGQRLGAIVVLGTAGQRVLAERGRRALQSLLSEHLAKHWDRVTLPRRWRFVAALPIDARGKLTQESFDVEIARPVPEPREPLFLSRFRDGEEEVVEFVVPYDLAYLEGHYDTFPLVPGAVQLHWVVETISHHLGRPVSTQRMEAIKFKNVLRPAQAFTMRLRFDDDGSRVAFTLCDPTRIFSSGRLALAA